MNNQQIDPEKMTRQQYREWQKRQASKNNRQYRAMKGWLMIPIILMMDLRMLVQVPKLSP